MTLTRMLATAAMCSALSFGAVAQAKSSKKHKHHSKTPTTAVSTETSAEAGAESPATSGEAPPDSSTATTTTTTTTTTPATSGDATGASPSGDPATVGAGTTSGSDSTATTSAPASDSGMAQAQPAEPVMVQPVEVTPGAPTRTVVFLPMVTSSEQSQYGYTPPLGIAIMAGGGAFDFIGGSIKAATDMGGFWTVRALFGSRSLIGLEAGYVGTAQGIQSLGLANNATLLSNGVEGTLRINAPIAIKRFLLEPFAFGGGGWSRYSIVNTNTQSASLKESDNVITVPVGGGLEMGYNGFFIDARYTYRFSFDNDLILLGDTGQNNWTAGGAIGFEF